MKVFLLLITLSLSLTAFSQDIVTNEDTLIDPKTGEVVRPRKPASTEPEFTSFYSLRIEALGGGSKLRYQNKSNGQITTTDSKKLLIYNLRLVRNSSETFRWFVGLNIEDVAFANLDVVNGMSFNPHVGLSWNTTNNLTLGLELSLYQHLEMNSIQEVFRRADPAVRLDWKYNLINWDTSRIGFGQNYLMTIPIKNETADPLDTNQFSDFDIGTNIYYRKSYESYSIEFSVQHNFRGYESYYYKMEMNDFSVGTRFSIPF